MSPAEIFRYVDGTTYAFCPDCDWTGPHRDTRPHAFDDATTHNLTHHLSRWVYGPDASKE